MKISDLCTALEADIQAAGNADKEITKAVVSDLLSFVIGTAPEGAAWITVQTHLNVAAVAVLKELPMIIIASGRKAAPDLIARCEEEKICVISVSCTVFGVCAKLFNLGIGE